MFHFIKLLGFLVFVGAFMTYGLPYLGAEDTAGFFWWSIIAALSLFGLFIVFCVIRFILRILLCPFSSTARYNLGRARYGFFSWFFEWPSNIDLGDDGGIQRDWYKSNARYIARFQTMRDLKNDFRLWDEL